MFVEVARLGALFFVFIVSNRWQVLRKKQSLPDRGYHEVVGWSLGGMGGGMI